MINLTSLFSRRAKPEASNPTSGEAVPSPLDAAVVEKKHSNAADLNVHAGLLTRPLVPELLETSFPITTQSSRFSILKKIVTDLQEVGVSISSITKEAVRGGIAEAARWGAEFTIICLALNAAAEKSPATLGLIIAGTALYGFATWGDRIWRTRVDEFDRAYSVSLFNRLLKTLGRSSITDLESPNRQALLELHHGRVNDISNLIETSVALPCHLIKLTLSAGALFYVDWRIPIVAIAAVIPGLLVKNRHVKEDLNLEESQSRRSKLVDIISDEAYSANGSLRMILGRMNGVQHSLQAIQVALNSEKNAHERRQAGQAVLTDLAYYGVLFGGMTMLFSQYQNGMLSIGGLGFLWSQLLELGSDLEDHSDQFRRYGDILNKAGRFYGFTDLRSDLAQQDFPENHRLQFKGGVRFERGTKEEDTQFEVMLPDFTLEPGDFLVIHGASGAGKTTIQKHIAFAAKPESGEFFVDSTPAFQIDFVQWLEHIAHCGASPSLLLGQTVRQALCLDQEGESFLAERLSHPLITDLIADITKTENGLDTRIGLGIEHGREFSSGELQRLALVVALVPTRKILFLDEVTSNQNESFVNLVAQSISDLRKQGTIVIMVTHSKKFDPDATHIMNVSKGVAELSETIRSNSELPLRADADSPDAVLPSIPLADTTRPVLSEGASNAM